MSRQNVVKTSDFIADYNRRDFDAAVRHFHPEIEWVLPALQRSDSCRGPEEVRRFWEGLDETFDELRLEPLTIACGLMFSYLVLSVQPLAAYDRRIAPLHDSIQCPWSAAGPQGT